MTKKSDIIASNKIFGWIGLGTIFVLLVPLIAMQFSDQVVWGVFDFIAMGALLFGTGALFVLIARTVQQTRYRIIIGIILLFVLLLTWAELAVGIIGTPFAGS